jgi:hypothetical protein
MENRFDQQDISCFSVVHDERILSRFLGAQTLHLLRTNLSYEPNLHQLIYVGVCTYETIRHLTTNQISQLPDPLPITAGRIHFIRQVQPNGTITFRNKTWRVSKRLAGKYVWATIITHCRRLEIWHERSALHDWRLLKDYAYDIPETVARLTPECAHAHRPQNRS